MANNKKNVSLRNIVYNVLLVVDDALNSHKDELNDETSPDIYQHIETISNAPTVRITDIAKQSNIQQQIEQLQQQYMMKQQYVQSHKPAVRRQNNKNKFYYHNKVGKLNRNYRTNNRFRYNRW